MIIDCGCGGKGRGDVNLDLYMYHSPDTIQYIDVKKIRNFINCSITNLPIRDNVGDVTCYHTIEHVLNVNDSIIEMRRVSNNKVIIVVPNNPVNNEYGRHLYSWSKSSLKAYLKCFFNDVDVQINTLKFIEIVYHYIKFIPVFFIRRRLYQAISRLIGLELIAICKVSKLKEQGLMGCR